MSGPFADITVVEFGQFVVAPFCAQLMADCGARVIKVEPPAGDSYRNGPAPVADRLTRQFMIKNRGKESIVVDLAAEDARPVVEALVREADVVLVNLSPAAVMRRRLDYESLRALNPDVIYASVSGFGFTGEESRLPGMDVVVQARSGLLTSLGAERDGVPFHSEVQIADYSTALLLFGGIAAALYARAETGVGQKVETSLLAGALAIQNNSIGHVHEADGWRERFVEDELPELRKQGAAAAAVHAHRAAARPDPASHTAHYRAFRTEDSFVAIGAGSPATRSRLAGALGVELSLMDDSPERFGEAISARLATDTTDHWIETLRAVDVPVAPVLTIDELLFDDHAIREGLIADYEHPQAGRYRAFGQPLRLSETPMRAGPPAPVYGAQTISILKDVGFDVPTINRLLESGAVRGSASEAATLEGENAVHTDSP